MSQHDSTKSINPLMAAVVGVAVGAAATYLMKSENRERITKDYDDIKNKAQDLLKSTQKKVEKTTSDLKSWAEDMGEKAEETANKIEKQARTRKIAAA